MIEIRCVAGNVLKVIDADAHHHADLSGAHLAKAHLARVNLEHVRMESADLSEADLRCARLLGANLQNAILANADLSCTNLAGADLRGAILTGASLRHAHLREANCSGANFTGADLTDATIWGANFTGAVGVELALAKSSIIPESGPFWAWKKCRDGILVQLEIPVDAQRAVGQRRECRAEFVRVLQVIGADFGVSRFDNTVQYRAGELVRCHQWDGGNWETGLGGIHFYPTKLEAENS